MSLYILTVYVSRYIIGVEQIVPDLSFFNFYTWREVRVRFKIFTLCLLLSRPEYVSTYFLIFNEKEPSQTFFRFTYGQFYSDNTGTSCEFN